MSVNREFQTTELIKGQITLRTRYAVNLMEAFQETTWGKELEDNNLSAPLCCKCGGYVNSITSPTRR
jgi:hypothetical protein